MDCGYTSGSAGGSAALSPRRCKTFHPHHRSHSGRREKSRLLSSAGLEIRHPASALSERKNSDCITRGEDFASGSCLRQEFGGIPAKAEAEKIHRGKRSLPETEDRSQRYRRIVSECGKRNLHSSCGTGGSPCFCREKEKQKETFCVSATDLLMRHFSRVLWKGYLFPKAAES